MRILLSVYACHPERGSEQGIGWGWLERLSRDHEVTALTAASNLAAIDPVVQRLGRPGLRVVGVETPGGAGPKWRRWWAFRAWQRDALRVAQDLHRETPFDVAHHATFGAHRIPSHLWRLGIPFLWGPVGGGEGVPLRFSLPRWLGWREAAAELARELSNRWVRHDPAVRRTVRHATAWAATTPQTLEVFPPDTHDRAIIIPAAFADEPTLRDVATRQPRPGPDTGLSVAFLGRLVGWKGLGLGVRAFARYAADRPTASLHLYGDGRARVSLERLVGELGITDRVMFHGHVPRSEALAAYARHHVLLFPSLHDSGGFVVIEAQAAGLPVVCLDTGGPGVLVHEQAGVKVPVTTPRRVISDLAAALTSLTTDQDRWRVASEAGRRHASPEGSAPTLERLTTTMYAHLERQLSRPVA